eukprot:5163096-Pyramimonas_sp.AAC.1
MVLHPTIDQIEAAELNLLYACTATRALMIEAAVRHPALPINHDLLNIHIAPLNVDIDPRVPHLCHWVVLNRTRWAV